MISGAAALAPGHSLPSTWVSPKVRIFEILPISLCYGGVSWARRSGLTKRGYGGDGAREGNVAHRAEGGRDFQHGLPG